MNLYINTRQSLNVMPYILGAFWNGNGNGNSDSDSKISVQTKACADW